MAFKTVTFFVILAIHLIVFSFGDENAAHNRAFDKVADLLKLKNHFLTIQNLDNMIDQLVGRFKCAQITTMPSSGTTCSKPLCLDAHNIFAAMAIADGSNMMEDMFGDLSSILLFHLLTIQNNCYQAVNITQSPLYYKTQLALLLDRNSDDKIEYDNLQDILEDLHDKYDDDDDHDDHNDHDDDHNDHHDDDHDDDKMTTMMHDDHMTTAPDHDHDHDDDDDHDDMTTNDDDHHHMTTVPSHHDDDHDDDKHDSHEHDDDDHDDHDDDENEIKSQSVKTKCLSPGMLYDDLLLDPEVDELIGKDHIDDLSAFMIYHFLSGAKVSKSCRLLPRKSMLFNELKHDFLKVQQGVFQKSDLETVYKKMFGNPTAMATVADDHSGHDHRRRRRSVSTGDQQQFQASTCYSADQLLAIHNIVNGSAIPENTIKDLCPSLLYLKVSDACVPPPANKTEKHETTLAERYGYGVLSVFIVCLCSLGGVFVLGCATTTSYYRSIMSIFIGLAVGTLSTDALLHLLPTAFGVHLHGGEDDGHDHSGDAIVFEDFIGYGLAALGGIYVFFLLEAIMAMVRGDKNGNDRHGHSHMMPSDMELNMGSKPIGNGSSRAELYTVDKSETGTESMDNPEDKSGGWSSVGIMVIVGDSIHNFADGLAIGAAFSQSGSVGVATSIAVFCHELPHELGDFAILVRSGMSVRKALFFNFMSALTAFVGLFIGLTIATDVVVRQWIFAVTAGLFIYIALADMIPDMVAAAVSDKRHGCRNFVLNNIGMLIGALILVLLSVFESHIKI